MCRVCEGRVWRDLHTRFEDQVRVKCGVKMCVTGELGPCCIWRRVVPSGDSIPGNEIASHMWEKSCPANERAPQLDRVRRPPTAWSRTSRLRLELELQEELYRKGATPIRGV